MLTRFRRGLKEGLRDIHGHVVRPKYGVGVGGYVGGHSVRAAVAQLPLRHQSLE